MTTQDSCQGLPSRPEHRAKYLSAAQHIYKKKNIAEANK